MSKKGEEMAILTLKRRAGKQLSKNFNSNEFDCKCGRCATTRVDEKLVAFLQALRDKLGKTITINSGYRCAAHNRAVGGASGSRHMSGTAADIVISGVSVKEVAKAAESVGFLGIIRYDKKNFVHVDTRTSRYFAVNAGKDTPVATFGGTVSKTYLSKGDRGDAVKALQKQLNAQGYKLVEDGIFGDATDKAVRDFQKKKGLAVDGKAGAKTMAALNVSGATLDRVLKQTNPRMKGEDVRTVQKALIAKGYSCGSYGADGVWGAGCTEGTIRFQKANGLVADGRVGKLTAAKLGITWTGK